jgi:hypothetical protein
MSMFLLNNTFIEKLYKHMRSFLWQKETIEKEDTI